MNGLEVDNFTYQYKKKELLIIKVTLFLYNNFSDSMKNKKKFLIVVLGLFLIVLSFILEKIDNYDKNYSYLNIAEYIVNNNSDLLNDEKFFVDNNLSELLSENIEVLKEIYKEECDNLKINDIKNNNCIKRGRDE